MAASIYDLSVTAASNTTIDGTDVSGATGKVKDGDNVMRSLGAYDAQFVDDLGAVNTVGGTGDVITVTLSSGFTAYATGQIFRFIAGAANTTNVTVNVNSIGAKAIRKISGGTDVALAAGDIAAGETYTVIYRASANAAAGAWVLVSLPAVAATSSTLGTVGLTQLGLAYNVGIASSVGSSALTVSLKGADGNDPSASNPVVIPFRNATLATGTPVMRTVTAATSIVVASTKTLGTSSGVAFRLWVLAVDTGSGIELGLVNCLSGTSIMALSSSDLYSPTATPGNSAQVIYTTSGQTSKPICVLGYLDFSSGEATAGTWATAADRIQVRNLGTKLPGDRVQLQRTDTGAVATGTTVVPIDDTIPQNTEGDQYMTQAITPSCAANILRATASGTYSNSGAANGNFVQALFRDSTASALAAANFILPASTGPGLFLTDKSVLAASTSTTTFKVRAGYQVAGTTTFNGSSAARQFGGVYNSFIQVEEIMA